MYKAQEEVLSRGGWGLLAENFICCLLIGVATISRIDKYVNACNPAKFGACIKTIAQNERREGAESGERKIFCHAIISE